MFKFPEQLLATDLQMHAACYLDYEYKWKKATKEKDLERQHSTVPPLTNRDIFKRHMKTIKTVLNQGRGLSLSEIRDMVNSEENSNLVNKDIKCFLIEESGEKIKFSESNKKNESHFVFSAEINIEDVINSLRNINVVKSAAKLIRKALLEVNFNLDDSFCDAHDLSQSWRKTKIPDVLLTFFSVLMNRSRVKLIEDDCEIDECVNEYNLDDEENDKHQSSMKVKSLFQIMYYHATHDRHKTPMHVMNAHTIYEKCRSKKLITTFNKQCMCINYKSMKIQRSNLAKFTVLQSLPAEVPLPSHFDRKSFTIAAFDNFDYADKNSLSGMQHAHDTAITLFQVKPLSTKSKPAVSSTDISMIKNLGKLKCQEIVPFRYNQKLPLDNSFMVEQELYTSQLVADNSSTTDFILSCCQSVSLEPEKDDNTIIPSWVGMKSMLSSADIPEMHVGFLPFIPNPVTEYSTVYTSMLNFKKLTKQFNQDALPVFCDEGVFRILVDIYLQRKDEFHMLIPMLGAFHTAKCVEHCIGKYIQGCGIEESLRQTKVLGVNVVDAVLNGINYTRSFKGFLILSNAIEILKWEASLKVTDINQFDGFPEAIKNLQLAFSSKNVEESKIAYDICVRRCEIIKQEFEKFSQSCNQKSEMCKHWNGMLKLISLLKDFVAADREGNWEAHLHTIQRLLPIFCMSGSINYLRYASWYLEKMQKLPEEHPQIYKHFQVGKFVVKTKPGFYKSVAPDMKLEQSIQRSKKSPGGIIGQTKHQAYVTEWELAYHEVLAISNCYSNITKSVLVETDAIPLHKELSSNKILEYREAVEKVVTFIKERGNPYETFTSNKLHHFTSGLLVDPTTSSKILQYFDKGSEEYLIFRKERYIEKSKRLGDSIKRLAVPTFLPKDKKPIEKVNQHLRKK